MIYLFHSPTLFFPKGISALLNITTLTPPPPPPPSTWDLTPQLLFKKGKTDKLRGITPEMAPETAALGNGNQRQFFVSSYV